MPGWSPRFGVAVVVVATKVRGEKPPTISDTQILSDLEPYQKSSDRFGPKPSKVWDPIPKRSKDFRSCLGSDKVWVRNGGRSGLGSDKVWDRNSRRIFNKIGDLIRFGSETVGGKIWDPIGSGTETVGGF